MPVDTTLPPLVEIPLWQLLRLPRGAVRLAQITESLRGRAMIRLKAGPKVFNVTADAEAARQVLQSNYKRYRKSDTYLALKPFLGEGLFTSEGEFWKRQRRLAQPSFHLEALAGLCKTMADETALMLDRWAEHQRAGRSFDLAANMMQLTLSVVGRTLFNVDLASSAGSVGSALTEVLRITDARLLSPLRVPLHWPTPTNRTYRAALASLDETVGAIIRTRREEAARGEVRADLLGMLLAARDEETGQGMSDAQLRDEVMTLVLAGHETTANALSWAFYLLSQNPECARRLRSSVRDVLGDRPPTFEDVPRLGYALMVVQESMRLYPPVWIMERTPLEPDVVCGYRMVPGDTVSVCTYALHHNESYWPNPEGFDPLRFEPGSAAMAARPKFAYLPFGGGPRVCIGNHFALMEAQVVLAMAFQRFRVDLVPGKSVEPALMLTLRPADGVWVTVEKPGPRDFVGAPARTSVPPAPGGRHATMR